MKNPPSGWGSNLCALTIFSHSFLPVTFLETLFFEATLFTDFATDFFAMVLLAFETTLFLPFVSFLAGLALDVFLAGLALDTDFLAFALEAAVAFFFVFVGLVLVGLDTFLVTFDESFFGATDLEALRVTDLVDFADLAGDLEAALGIGFYSNVNYIGYGVIA